MDGATSATGPIFTAGITALVGGMVSRALGEYVSVSSQRDSQRALIAKQRQELRDNPDEELEELAGLYQVKRLSPETSRQVVKELTEHDALAAHLTAELDIDEEDDVNPWHAAFASTISFAIGGVLPMLAIIPPQSSRVLIRSRQYSSLWPSPARWEPVWVAHHGSLRRVRTLIGGALALVPTNGIGVLLHTQGSVGRPEDPPQLVEDSGDRT